MSNFPPHIAVIGAGLVGVSCALWLQKKGFRVSLADGNEPGSMTSSGNACTIADYACVPVNHPGLVRRLPTLMWGRDSPLSINPWYAVTHFPWMLSFLRHCTRSEVNKTIQALGDLLRLTHDGLDPLIRLTRTQDLFETNGCMYVYESEAAFNRARQGNQARAEQGAKFTELTAPEIRDLEPNLKPHFAKGLLFRHARHVLNPKTLVKRFFESFLHHHGRHLFAHVKGITRNEKGLQVHLSSGEGISADQVVISSGAFSKQITGCGLAGIPLDTERGYHIQYADQQHLVNRPVAWADCGFYATPMNEGLRFAGTVEIAGLSPKKNPRHLDYLARKAQTMFDLEREPTTSWLGYRPTLPDARPVIGSGRKDERIIHAFGHQHIGLTLAGITGRLVSELAAGEPPCVNLQPFHPDRFRSA